MKKEIVLDRMLKTIVILTIVLISLQYYFYRLRERQFEQHNVPYVANHELEVIR